MKAVWLYCRQHRLIVLLYNGGILLLLYLAYSFWLVPQNGLTGGPGDSIAGAFLIFMFLFFAGMMGLFDLALHCYCHTVSFRITGVVTTIVFWLISTFIFSLSSHPEHGEYIYDNKGEVAGYNIGWNEWIDFSYLCLCIAGTLLFLMILGHFIHRFWIRKVT